MGTCMKKIYIDTSYDGEITREKHGDNVFIGYDVDGKVVGVEIINPISLDIDDDEVISYQTLEKVMDTEEWGNA